MKTLPIPKPRPLLPVLIFVLLLSGCGFANPFKTSPQLGDIRQRQSDGMTMVFVPAGEFSMGIDVDGMLYALQLCKKAPVTTGPACPGSSYADEMPMHLVKLDAFWIDLTEVTNQGTRDTRAVS